MKTPQEHWDDILVQTWRQYGSVLDVIMTFKRTTGKQYDEYDPPLLRTPHKGFPWKLPVRIFMANHLEKISLRLFAQPPERDVAMLNKLKDSKYTTTDRSTQTRDAEKEKQQRHAAKNQKIIELNNTNYENRNHATDWNVVQGKTRRKR
jgi:hypothetical protein